ncbi:hypothetical protein ABEB36_000528 [Hypothenemus hampei]|uniref:Uncharacterized protein n=1 Tax=Hypothenemus hampei TaxID=57062 RepID=A0ABD1FBK8_HYPHA
MKSIVLLLGLATYIQCAKLDHLTYLPPSSRPQQPENLDEGLAAPSGVEVSRSALTQPQTSAPSSQQPQIPILKLNTENSGDGNYRTEYETGNGIQAEETGENNGDSSVVQGSFSYTSPEGQHVGLSYKADENGYQPQGDNLPTPPPVPDAIQKSLEYNQAHPEEDDSETETINAAPVNSRQYLAPQSNTVNQAAASAPTRQQSFTPQTNAIPSPVYGSPVSGFNPPSTRQQPNVAPQTQQHSFVPSGPQRYSAPQQSNIAPSNAPQPQQSSFAPRGPQKYTAPQQPSIAPSGPQRYTAPQQSSFATGNAPQFQQSSFVSSGPQRYTVPQQQNFASQRSQQASEPSGYQYNHPNIPFPTGNARSQQGAGEFGQGFSGNRVAPVGTPGVQAQDENGGYLY